MDFFTPEIMAYIITGILSIISGIFGTKYKKKNVLETIIKAAEDDKTSADEVQKVIISLKNLK